ncbi:hypothetical protein LGL55_12955 [Clostridium tagluense]|uniref:hypothetical protein n=1 Tax=Clostridium tagluense TaxID=360422 RepID=UPI001CF57E6E|nr:hypothetical protein [Clostridium tagluense]MCB2311020.1 hypothetical protein [Clostridium tagluense]MCB2316878.1 hypothetical protein [Clostridium tagluense]MCB2321740.1 hypothetical protein [Clostridium tagluense]MCB2325654.1 hypothetical protein [Clostridium tagluense]MCB2331470.1 hypothetical protein [Clostridium tagluense]
MSIYFLLLLVMAVLLYVGIISSLTYAPKKIKIISAIVLSLMTFRYAALIILFTIKNQSYLYLLKPLVYANLLCIPICGILSVLIFSRNNKIKLKKNLFVCAMIGIAYFIVIYKSSANIDISNNYGYTMELQLEVYCYIVLLIINSIFFIKGIKLYNKIYANKLGALLIMIASSITLLSVVITSINSNFSMIFLGDIAWIATIDYGLIKFKR